MADTPRRAPSLITPMLIVATVFMIVAAYMKSAWGDEVFSLRVAAMPLADMLNTVAADSHPPLYYLILKLLFAVSDPFTSGDWEARLIIARGFSIGCWAAVLILASALYRELAAKEQSYPLFVELALVLSPALMLFGRMARYYSLLALLFAYLLLLLIRRLKRDNGAEPPGGRWKFTLAAAAMLLIAYIGAPLLAVLFIAFAVSARHSIQRIFELAPRFILPFVALAPWLIFAWNRVRETSPAPGETSGLAAGVKTMIVDIVYGTWVLTWGEHLALVLWFAALPILGILVLRTLGSLHASPDDQPESVRVRRFTFAVVALSITGLAFGAGFVFSLGTEFFPARLAFIVAPLLALGFAALTRKPGILTQVALWVTILLFAAGNLAAFRGEYGLQSTYDAPYELAAGCLVRDNGDSAAPVLIDSDALALHYEGGDFGSRRVVNITSGLPDEELIRLWDKGGPIYLAVNPGINPPDALIACWNEAHPDKRFVFQRVIELHEENAQIFRLKLRLGMAKPTPVKLAIYKLTPFLER